MNRKILLGVLLWALAVSAAFAEGGIALQRFSAIQVLDLENPRNERGERLPPQAVPKLKDAIMYSLVQLHCFHQVIEYRDPQVRRPESHRMLHLKGKVLAYSGTQDRPFATVEVRFVDPESRELLLERTFKVVVFYDADTLEALMRKLARSIASLAKNNW